MRRPMHWDLISRKVTDKIHKHSIFGNTQNIFAVPNKALVSQHSHKALT